MTNELTCSNDDRMEANLFINLPIEGIIMKNKLKRERLKYFIWGVLLVISLVVLTGAYQSYLGRYQVSAWSADSIGFGAFVADTNTGENKIVYLNSSKEKQNHLGMPFKEF